MERFNFNWENIPNESTKVVKAKTIKEVLDFIVDNTDSSLLNVYRGQSNSEWKIVSSIQRMMKKSPADIVDESIVITKEKEIFKELKTWAIENIDQYTELALLSFLQHHGGPTRLIDVTKDPFVGLFFACNENSHVDGTFFIFSLPINTPTYTVKFDPMNIILNGTTATIIEGTNYNSVLKKQQEQNTPAILTSYINEPRIKAQRAAFLFGYCGRNNHVVNYIEAFNMDVDIKKEHLKVLIIKKELKNDILKLLDSSYGINYKTLFPDFEGASLYFKKKK